MKFLLFNIVVAGALLFLATGSRTELHAVVDRAHDAAVAIKDKALDAIDRETPAKPAAAAVPAKTAPAPAQKQVAAAPTPRPAPPPPAVKPQPEKAAAAVPVRKAPASPPAPAPASTAGNGSIDVASLPPAVAKRRAEVLGNTTYPDSLPAQTSAAPPATPDGAADAGKFMSPAERQRDLMELSQQMELFSVEAMSQ